MPHNQSFDYGHAGALPLVEQIDRSQGLFFNIYHEFVTTYLAIILVTQTVRRHIDEYTVRQSVDQVNYADSRCSFVYPINEAINFYVRKELDVIFGPFCDYAAAPLARQITFWSIPMLTAGAMAADFARYRLLHYPLLTRIGPNFISLTQFLSTMLRGYKWNIVQLLYDPYGQGYFEDKFCHIASDSIHYGLKDEFKAPYQKFEKTEDLLTELGTVLGVNVAERFLATKTRNCGHRNSDIERVSFRHQENYPINEAIRFYVRKERDASFGPFCDHAAAPPARQITFWSIPILTTCAMAAEFSL
uniref:Receptor ligand binding region domain-containing protein n=1 Tax=Octopus bimaculoides TaxID=37653 RepID=A0A0L8GK02_OCTBM